MNDAGPSEPGEPSEPIVIDVPGVQIAPYFVHTLNDTMALENDTVSNYNICQYILSHTWYKDVLFYNVRK